MSKTYALNIDQVRTLKNELSRDIIMSPVLSNARTFRDLYIKVYTDIESMKTDFIFRRKAGNARKYEVGKPIKHSTVGYIEENPLIVKQSAALYYENLQKFREKEPFSIKGANQSYNAPVSEFIMRRIGESYAGDVLNCLFWGDRSLDDDNPLNLYDGYWTQINRMINEGKISISNGNLVEIDTIEKTSDMNPGDIYDIFVNFIEQLDETLRNAEHLVVYCSANTRRLIVSDYMKAYPNAYNKSSSSSSFGFIDMPNVELVTNAIVGKGDKLIATVPDNLQFGLDEESDWNAVHLDRNPEDQNELIFQIQSTQGVRILDVSRKRFAVSTGSIAFNENLIGDYTKDTLTVSSNDDTMGEVTVTPEQDEYKTGDNVTMTATAKTGYEFVAWSDGATINPRTYVYGGAPIAFQAIFKKTETPSGGTGE